MSAVTTLIVAGLFIIGPDLCQPENHDSPTSSPSRHHTSGEGTNHKTSKGSHVAHTDNHDLQKVRSVRTLRRDESYWSGAQPSKPEPQRTQSSQENEPLLGEESSSSYIHTTGSTGTPLQPKRVLLRRSEAMPKPEKESGLKSPRKTSVSPEKRPLLPTGKTASTTGGKPPKHLSVSRITAGLHDIKAAIMSKGGDYERLDKGKSPALSSEEQIVFGVFTGEGGHSITFEECGEKCKAHFGEMYLTDNNRVPLARHFIVEDKKTKAVRCNCMVNAERIRDFLQQAKLGYRYPDFLRNARTSFCAARHWLYVQKIPVDIPYEVESKKLKSPEERAKFSRLKSIGETRISPLDFERIKREEEERKAPKKKEQHNNKRRASSEDSSEKGEGVAEISPEEGNIIVGAFPRKKHEEKFTDRSCKTICREFFGNVAVYRETPMGFTQPELLDGGDTCSCVVSKRLAVWAASKNHDTKFLEGFRHFYCKGQLWFSDPSGAGPFDIYVQHDMDAHPNREVKQPKLDLETFNKEAAAKKSMLLELGISEEEYERQLKAEAQKAKAEARQSKEKAELQQILLGSNRKHLLRTFTTETCQKYCNDKFGFVNHGVESAPPGHPGHKGPTITYKAVKFTTAMVTDHGKECKCYFNTVKMLEVLESKKDFIKTNWDSFKKNLLDYLRLVGYKSGVEYLKKNRIHIVGENGSDLSLP